MSATHVILCAATLFLGAYLGYAVEEFTGPVIEKKLPGNEYLVEVARRVGATQGFLLIVPERIQASVVLFAGGHGHLAITITAGSTNWAAISWSEAGIISHWKV